MTSQSITTEELLTSIHEVENQLFDLMANLDEQAINRVPYADSWTAGQLFRHVAKSTSGIGMAMSLNAKPAERDPGARIQELKKTFLDFGIKMNSPKEIVPEAGPYEKQAIMKELSTSFDQLDEKVRTAHLADLVSGSPLGEITKLEMLHFVLYHTQRHLHQMRRIHTALTNQ